MTSEELIVNYGELLLKAAEIVRAGDYGSPSVDLEDAPLLSVCKDEAKLAWTEYEDVRAEAVFPLWLLDATAEQLAAHYAEREAERAARKKATVEWDRERREAADRAEYERLQKKYGP